MNFGLLRSVEHPLMLKKLIEHRCEDGIADTSPYKLTEQAKRTLLAEKINVTEEQLADGIRAEDLTAAKEMFDVEENQRPVEELRSFLEPDRYNGCNAERLANSNRRKAGFRA